nr:MAG TPA: hypothetical protein [Caudoviricetes sp.]
MRPRSHCWLRLWPGSPVDLRGSRHRMMNVWSA